MNAMLDYSVFLSLFALACCTAPSASKDVTAALYESPSFSCSLPDATGVKQITWQRLGPDDSVKTMVTYSEIAGQQVPEPYADRVEVTLVTLNNMNIVLKNVTFADDGCYICTFNAYPSGTKRTKSCLTVQSLSEIKTSWTLHHSNEKEAVVSCSATGKPAPVITWPSAKQMADNSKEIPNDDGTFTVESNLTVLLSSIQNKPLECLVQSGGRNSSKFISAGNDKTPDPESGPRQYFVTVPVVIICFICVIILGLVLHRKRNKYEKESIEAIV